MFNKPLVIIIIALVLILSGIQTINWLKTTPPPLVPEVEISEANPGGETTVPYKPFASFMQPAANLPTEEQPHFHAGKALAHQPWVKAPTITFARDGLGPLYNARTCLACHINGGRGIMPRDGNHLLFTNFLRLSIPGKDKIHGVIPEPTYGDQLQAQSTALAHQLKHLKVPYQEGQPKPEGYLYISWPTKTFVYPDGQITELRYPDPRIENLGYGPMHPETMMGIRNAPPIHGVGLLELIPQSQIDQIAESQNKQNDEISGRINQVWDYEAKKTVPGRFGLKANKASVRLQTAGALNGDMGITNPIFRDQPCTEAQVNCQKQIHGTDKHGNEVSEKQLSMFVDFTRSLGVPERRNPNHPTTLKGREHFYQIGCASCHHPSYTTANSERYPYLSNQKIWPYTDLLLHDMGPDLADGRPDYEADGNEWRTPPLWGIGLSKKVNGAQNFLHDGRARTIEEAILWHGGEAEKVKQQFTSLDKVDREALIRFVESL